MAFPSSAAAPIRSAVEADNRISTRLNKAGTEAQNPIIGNSRDATDTEFVAGGFAMRLKFPLVDKMEQVYGSSLTILNDDGSVISSIDITNRWSTFQMEARLDLVAGVDFESFDAPKRVLVQAKTSRGRHQTNQFWVSNLPANQVLVNGVQTEAGNPLEILVESLGVPQRVALQFFPSLNDEVGRQHGSDKASIEANVVKPYGGAEYLTMIRNSVFVDYANSPVRDITYFEHTPTVNGEVVQLRFQFTSALGSASVVECFAYVKFTVCEDGGSPVSTALTTGTNIVCPPCPQPPVIENPGVPPEDRDNPSTIEEDSGGRYVRVDLTSNGDLGEGTEAPSVSLEFQGYEGSGGAISSSGSAGTVSIPVTEQEYKVYLPTEVEDSDLVIVRPSTAAGQGGALIFLRSGTSQNVILSEAVSILDQISIQTAGNVGQTDLTVSPDDGQIQQITSAVGATPSTSQITVTISNPTDEQIRWRLKGCGDFMTIADHDRQGRLGPLDSVQVTVGIRSTDREGENLPEADYNGYISVYSLDRNDRRVFAIPVRLVVGAGTAVTGTTYYIDYDGGSDSNDGTSSLPFKHHPWDSNATGQAALVTLGAGDMTVFKGGVVYRGYLFGGGATGTVASNIIIDGNTEGTFGVGQAILDASEALTGWTDQGGGVFRASLPDSEVVFPGNPFTLNMYEGQGTGVKLMAPSQWPVNQPDLQLWDDMGGWPEIPSLSQISTPDDAVPFLQWDDFALLPSDFHVEGWIATFDNGNRVGLYKIESFDPVTNTITFGSGSGQRWISIGGSSPNWTLGTPLPRFCLMNIESALSQPGTYFYNATNETIDYIPYSGTTPTSVTATKRFNVIDCYELENVTFRGMICQKASGQNLGQAGAWSATLNGCTNVKIEGCTARFCRSTGARASIYMSVGTTGFSLKNSLVIANRQSRGIQMTNAAQIAGQTDFNVEENLFCNNGGTQIAMFACEESFIWFNDVYNHGGTHANGVSTYSGCKNTRVHRNDVGNGNIAYTIQLIGDGDDLTIDYNKFSVIESFLGFQFTVATWSTSSNVRWMHNVMKNPYGTAYLHSQPPGANLVLANNVMDGAAQTDQGAVSEGGNILTADWNGNYTLGSSDFGFIDPTTVFVDYANNDFRLRDGSVGISNAVSIPIYTYPSYIPQRGDGYDIGAEEFEELVPLHRINCGSTTYTDPDGNVWADDFGFSGASGVFSTSDPISGTELDTIYQTERGVSVDGEEVGFEYQLTVPDGKFIEVRLHFAEIYTPTSAVGARLLDVYMNGNQVEDDLDIFQAVGGDAAYVKTYQVPSNSTTLTIRIENGTVERGKVNGIEVFDTGLSSAGIDHVVTLTEENQPFTDTMLINFSGGIDYNLSFDDSVGSAGDEILVNFSGTGVALHRISCGSESDIVDSSGNTWDADRDFSGSVTVTQSTTTAIDNTEDDALYQQTRALIANGSSFGFEYTLNVPTNTALTVRILQAEIYDQIGIAGRIFSHEIDGVVVDPLVDIYEDAGSQHFYAVVYEYNVTSDSSGSIVVRLQNGTADKCQACAIEVLQ